MLARGTRTGIEEYTINLLSNMLGLDKNIKFKLFYNGRKKTELKYDFLKLPNVELKELEIPNRILDLSFRFLNFPKIDELLGGADVFFSPHIFSSAVSKKCKTVVTFHDLSFASHPEFYSAGKNYWHFSMNPKRQARKADKIIAVSKSTKDDLVNLYKINPDKITVIYSGINLEAGILNLESGILEVKKKYNLPDYYILYLGTLEPRKNIVNLIKAFELFKKNELKSNKLQATSYKLIIAGAKGWLYEDIFKAAKKSAFKNDIIFTGFADDEDKPVLYSLADLFVYPSFYEGFGFPPLEAMSHGTPVITSDFSSLPEAVGDAAIMVNPYNPNELAKAMELVLGDEKLKSFLIKKGFEQIKKFSWHKCAGETLDVLKQKN